MDHKKRGHLPDLFSLLSGPFLTVLLILPSLEPAKAQTDVTPPTLLSVSLTPNPVNFTGTSQTLTVQLGASDDLSGVEFKNLQRGAYVAVTITSPSGNQKITVSGQTFTQISTTNPIMPTLGGVWQSTVSVSAYSESGAWKITSVQFPDAVDNLQSYNASQLAALGCPGCATPLTINSTPDTAPPQLTGLTLNPSSVDVSAGPQTITASFVLTDNLSGVTFPSGPGINSFDFRIESPSGAQSQYRAANNFQLVSGTPQNGTWQTTFPIPRYSEPGTWSIQLLRLQDAANNAVTLNATSITNLGLSPSLTVTSTPSDTAPPQLLSLSFSPILIDAASSLKIDRTVNVMLSATDNLSGVSWNPETPNFGFGRGVKFTSPSGQQFEVVGQFNSLIRTMGSATNGVWSGSLVFPQFSEAGTWQASVVGLEDATTNNASYSTLQLQSLFQPVNLNLILPSLQNDGTVGTSGGTIKDSVFGSRAEIIYPAGVLSPGTAVAIDVLQTSLHVPTPLGFSATPASFFVNILLTPAPSFPLPTPGVRLVLPLPTFLIPGTQLALYRIDPAMGSVKELDPSGNAIFGTVNGDGLSVTFQNVVHLSLLVALLPVQLVIQIEPPNVAPAKFNIDSEGALAVAILGSANFDATTIDPTSVKFGPKSAKNKGVPVLKDVNNDGKLDLILYFAPDESGVGCYDTAVGLNGQTFGKSAFAGEETIKTTHTFPCPRP